MAAPTETSIQNQISAQNKILNEVRKFANVNTENLDDLINTLTGLLETEYAPEVTASTDSVRSAVSSSMSQTTASGMLTPYLRAYAKNLGFPETDPLEIIARLRKDFVERGIPESVKTRGFAFGAVIGSGTPVGDGVIHRLTVDKDTVIIESATPEVKTLRCTSDAHSGSTKHSESFSIQGDLTPRDLVDAFVGEDRSEDEAIAGLTASDTNALGFQNSSFETEMDATGTLLTALSGWRIGTAVANLATISGDLEAGTGLDDFYREITAEGTEPRSIRFLANETITQRLGRDVSVTFDEDVPYIVQVAVKRESSATGFVTVTLGTKSVALDISTISPDQWGVALIPINSNDQWLAKFNADPLELKIAVSTLAIGTVLIDDVIVAPMTRFDGTYWAAIGGRTAWLFDDTYLATDTVTSEDNDAINQLWHVRAFGYDGYLPSDATPTWPDPT